MSYDFFAKCYYMQLINQPGRHFLKNTISERNTLGVGLTPVVTKVGGGTFLLLGVVHCPSALIPVQLEHHLFCRIITINTKNSLLLITLLVVWSPLLGHLYYNACVCVCVCV